jgi:hypothetical protein
MNGNPAELFSRYFTFAGMDASPDADMQSLDCF